MFAAAFAVPGPLISLWEPSGPGRGRNGGLPTLSEHTTVSVPAPATIGMALQWRSSCLQFVQTPNVAVHYRFEVKQLRLHWSCREPVAGIFLAQ